MEAGTAANRRIYRALAGFQAGMAGVIVMLLWLALASSWYRRSMWMAANVMAAAFYGDDAVRGGFAFSTLAGLALYVVEYSLFGAAFGALVPESVPRLRGVLIGVLAGLAWYYLWFGLLWPRLSPLVALYTHDRPMLWGHVFYGLMLGRVPLYLELLQGRPLRRTVPAARTAPAPTQAVDAPLEHPAEPPRSAAPAPAAESSEADPRE